MADIDIIRRIKVATDQNANGEIPFAVFFNLLLGIIPTGLQGERGPPGTVGEAYTMPDADYLVPGDAGLVEVQAVTAPRKITLPTLALFPLARDLVIADFSGTLSSDRPVSIVTPAGSGTKIVGTYDDSYSLVGPGMFVRLRRGKQSNAWVVC